MQAVTSFGWICTGPMNAGTVLDGLARAWPFFLFAVVAAIGIYFIHRKIKTRTLRVILYLQLIPAIILAVIFGGILFDFGMNCTGNEPSDYEVLIKERGIR